MDFIKSIFQPGNPGPLGGGEGAPTMWYLFAQRPLLSDHAEEFLQ